MTGKDAAANKQAIRDWEMATKEQEWTEEKLDALERELLDQQWAYEARHHAALTAIRFLREGHAAQWREDWKTTNGALVRAHDELDALRTRCSVLERERDELFGRVERAEGERDGHYGAFQRKRDELEAIDEGGRALDAVVPAKVNESKADHLKRVATEFAALRSRYEEARRALERIVEAAWTQGATHMARVAERELKAIDAAAATYGKDKEEE